MAKNYHNTTNLTGSKLKKAIDTSLSQESVILEIFKQGKKYSPSQVNKIIRRECLKCCKLLFLYKIAKEKEMEIFAFCVIIFQPIISKTC